MASCKDCFSRMFLYSKCSNMDIPWVCFVKAIVFFYTELAYQ